MKWPGISLRTMMFAVAIFAANFAFLTGQIPLPEMLDNDEIETVLIGLLPMANILVFSLPRLLWLGLARFLRRGRQKPFAVGFHVTSWVSTLAVLIVFLWPVEIVGELMTQLCPGVLNDINSFFNTGCSYSLKARYLVPPVDPSPVGFLECCCNALSDWLGSIDWIIVLGAMACFSLPPLLISLAGGLVTRFVVRRRARAKSA